MTRRKDPVSIRSSDEERIDATVSTRVFRDPTELRIYMKQLSRALKFLPLGSRAYYAVSGELLRASTKLRALTPSGPTAKEH